MYSDIVSLCRCKCDSWGGQSLAGFTLRKLRVELIPGCKIYSYGTGCGTNALALGDILLRLSEFCEDCGQWRMAEDYTGWRYLGIYPKHRAYGNQQITPFQLYFFLPMLIVLRGYLSFALTCRWAHGAQIGAPLQNILRHLYLEVAKQVIRMCADMVSFAARWWRNATATSPPVAEYFTVDHRSPHHISSRCYGV